MGGAGLAGVGIAAAAVAAGIGIFGFMATKAAAEFQAAMTLVHTQAGASEEEVKSMTAAVLALSPAVGFGPTALAEALFHIESAGLRGSKALDILTLAAQGAKVGHADLESVTNGLIAAVNSGIGGIHNMTEGMGVLNAIVGAGNLRMGDLTAAFGTGILSVASTFGVSIQSVGAAIADMASQGIPAEEAATRLRMTLSLLGAPTAHAAAVLQGLGISSTQLASDMREGGILQAVQDLKTHLDNSGLSAEEQAAAISRAFGGGRSSAAIMVLLNSVEKLGVVQDKVNAGTGTFAEAWAKTAKETQTAGEIFQATLDSITTAVGLGFLPAVDQILSAVQPVLTSIATWTAANPNLAAQILIVVGGVSALIAGIVFLGPILEGIGGAIGVILNPFLAIGAAILALAAHFGLLGDGAKGMVDGLGATLSQMIPGVLATLNQLASDVVTWISAQIPKWIETLAGWAQAFVDWVGPMIPPAIAALGQLATEVIAWIAAQVPGWLDQLGQWASAFVDWIAPMIPLALGALGDAAGQIITWIGQQAPAFGEKLKDWAAAFVDWVGPVIGNAVAHLGDLAAAVLTWATAQIPEIAKAVAPIGMAIISGIVDVLVSLPGHLGDALGDAMNNFDPAKLDESLSNMLRSGGLIAGVIISAQIVGAAWAAAFGGAAALVRGATALITGAIQAEQGLIAAGARGVGTFVGAAFSEAFSLAAKAIGLLGSALVAAFAPVGAVLASAMAPVGAAVGAALDTAIGVGMVVGIPLLIGAAIAALGVGLALLINQVFPGFAANLAAAFFRGVEAVKTFVTNAAATMVGIIKGVLDAIAGIISGAADAIAAVGKIPNQLRGSNVGHDPIGDFLFGTGGSNTGYTGAIPHFATGGVVQGSGPQLAVVHGGETITPAGGSGTTTLVNHTHLSIDGNEIREIVETVLFNSASTSSSGFAGSPVTS